MSKYRRDSWSDFSVRGWITRLTASTWSEGLRWRRSLGKYWRCHRLVEVNTVCLLGNRLVWIYRGNGDYETGPSRYVSDPIPADVLAPLLEAIVFTQEKKDG